MSRLYFVPIGVVLILQAMIYNLIYLCIERGDEVWIFPWDSHQKCVNYKLLQVALSPSVLDTYQHTMARCKQFQIKSDDIQM